MREQPAVVKRRGGVEDHKFILGTLVKGRAAAIVGRDRGVWDRANGAKSGSAEPVDGAEKIDLLDQFDESDHIAADGASEAPPGAGGRPDVQVWTSSIRMQRTPADE